ncbi:MAG: hypothetical protein SVY53_02135 [Chloroflexota bacterium]|nr:hypothetical protein [Chloroflexota bacterium]
MHLAWQGEVFHGDLHMGNIYLIKPKFEGDHWRYFLCDFRMYERVSREEWRAMIVLLWGMLGGMPDMAVEGMKSVHVMSENKLRDVDWNKLLSAFSDFSSSWIEIAPEEASGMRLRRSKLNEGGLTRQLVLLLMNQVIASGLRLPYWIWLVLKSYVYL